MVVMMVVFVSRKRSGARSQGVLQQTSLAASAAAAAAAAGGHPLGNERRPDVIPGFVPPKGMCGASRASIRCSSSSLDSSSLNSSSLFGCVSLLSLGLSAEQEHRKGSSFHSMPSIYARYPGPTRNSSSSNTGNGKIKIKGREKRGEGKRVIVSIVQCFPVLSLVCLFFFFVQAPFHNTAQM